MNETIWLVITLITVAIGSYAVHKVLQGEGEVRLEASLIVGLICLINVLALFICLTPELLSIKGIVLAVLVSCFGSMATIYRLEYMLPPEEWNINRNFEANHNHYYWFNRIIVRYSFFIMIALGLICIVYFILVILNGVNWLFK